MKILVVGDVVLDEYISGTYTKENPTVLTNPQSLYACGGAAAVALSLVALGERVSLISIVGVDNAARRIERDLASLKYGYTLLRDNTRVTTHRQHIITDHPLVCIEKESLFDFSNEIKERVLMKVLCELCDVVLLLEEKERWKGIKKMIESNLHKVKIYSHPQELYDLIKETKNESSTEPLIYR